MALPFFILFYVLFVFVLLNMFISILLAAYDQQKFELELKLARGDTDTSLEEFIAIVKSAVVVLVVRPAQQVGRGVGRFFSIILKSKPKKQFNIGPT